MRQRVTHQALDEAFPMRYALRAKASYEKRQFITGLELAIQQFRVFLADIVPVNHILECRHILCPPILIF